MNTGSLYRRSSTTRLKKVTTFALYRNLSPTISCKFIFQQRMSLLYLSKNILNSGSLLMAMSFGKCAVAPAIGSIEEVACKRGWFAYQAESELGFALKQALLCDDIQIREQEVLRYTSERFGWDRVADSVSKLYSDILG